VSELGNQTTLLTNMEKEQDAVSDFSGNLTFKPNKSSKDDEVILNVSPKKYDKPKDQIFLDFFSIYTKSFVDEKKSEQTRKVLPAQS
jgi:hypothetical protein